MAKINLHPHWFLYCLGANNHDEVSFSLLLQRQFTEEFPKILNYFLFAEPIYESSDNTRMP